MVDQYARDPMGLGAPLDSELRDALPDRLAAHPAMLGWLAWLDGKAVGVVAALNGFSTFKAKSRINVHDLAIAPGHRGIGVGRKLLEAVEAYARVHDCCELTLEVRADNDPAKHLYRKLGFAGPEQWTPPETMAFWKKVLD